MRLIQKLNDNGMAVKMYFNHVDKEYVVYGYNDASNRIIASYYTDNKDDALGTMAHMFSELAYGGTA